MSPKDENIALLLDELKKNLSISAQMNQDWLTIKNELEERSKAERLVTTQVATSDASTFFDAQAGAHALYARIFGIAALLVTAGVIGWVYATRKYPLGIRWQSGHVPESIVQGLPHFTLLTLATFAIGILLRNYRINQHLSVLNQTKSTTLRAGESYVKSVQDSGMRDIVLETLVRSVFALGETGYLQGDQERPIAESPNLSSLIHVIGGAPTNK